MSETVKFWFEELYKNEIDETKETIKNEELWIKGASNKEEELMYITNIELMKEYIDALTEKLNEL